MTLLGCVVENGSTVSIPSASNRAGMFLFYCLKDGKGAVGSHV